MDGAGLANHEPQVLIRGGHLKKLVIYIDMAAPENGMKTRQEVPLTEVSLFHLSHTRSSTCSPCISIDIQKPVRTGHSLCRHHLSLTLDVVSHFPQFYFSSHPNPIYYLWGAQRKNALYPCLSVSMHNLIVSRVSQTDSVVTPQVLLLSGLFCACLDGLCPIASGPCWEGVAMLQ